MAEGSFLKKIKKGMKIDEEKTGEKEIKEIPVDIDEEEEEEKEKEEEEKEEKPAKTIKKQKIKIKKPPAKEKWPKAEGQLAIDIYQTDSELVVQSAIAGVKPEDLDIAIEGDLITIKGERRRPFGEDGDYFSQECYWGEFSRQIILPVEIDPGRAEATLREGILTIRVPKISRERKRKITVKRI